MKFLIEKPDHLSNPKHWVDQSDVIEFYESIEQVLNECGVEYKITNKPIKKPVPGFHCIAYHYAGEIQFDNFWTLKKGYIPDYLYLANDGFSGWSQLGKGENDSRLKISRKPIKGLLNEYIKSNKSKINQSDYKFKHENPFVFVAGQRPNDVVSELSYIETYELIQEVIYAYENTGIDVVVKRHPFDDHYLADEFYEQANWESHVRLTDASIHKIIPQSMAVYTVNSGVGFEALFHNKYVFTSGGCDYAHLTSVMNEDGDVWDSVEKVRYFKDYNITGHEQLSFMMHEHFIHKADKSAIKKRLGL